MGSFYDLLKKRRAVRSYTGERVPRETLERIARAARRGPNAGYSQGLRILVVDDPATIAAFTVPRPTSASRAVVPQGRCAHLRTDPGAGLPRPLHAGRQARGDRRGRGGLAGAVLARRRGRRADARCGSLRIEEGLGAGVYGVPVEEDARVRELLGIPDDLTIVMGVTVGHPAEDPDWDRASSVFSQRRRAEDEVVRWNRWGS